MCGILFPRNLYPVDVEYPSISVDGNIIFKNGGRRKYCVNIIPLSVIYINLYIPPLDYLYESK